MASRFSSGPPHKLSSIISSLLSQRQAGQANSNPALTTAAALWARHSQHLKNAHQTTEKSTENFDNKDATDSNVKEETGRIFLVR